MMHAFFTLLHRQICMDIDVDEAIPGGASIGLFDLLDVPSDEESEVEAFNMARGTIGFDTIINLLSFIYKPSISNASWAADLLENSTCPYPLKRLESCHLGSRTLNETFFFGQHTSTLAWP